MLLFDIWFFETKKAEMISALIEILLENYHKETNESVKSRSLLYNQLHLMKIDNRMREKPIRGMIR